jgi:hypothetical protein
MLFTFLLSYIRVKKNDKNKNKFGKRLDIVVFYAYLYRTSVRHKQIRYEDFNEISPIQLRIEERT